MKNNLGTFDKIQETHTEKVYLVDKLVKMITESGLEYVATYADFSFDEPKTDSERIFIVARKIKA